jgi:hypothetical protein
VAKKQQLLVDIDEYEKYLRPVASLAGLYGESDVPIVNFRFVEKLFCHITGAEDLASSDESFDAKLEGGIGVGVKTFRVHSRKSKVKTEKVAEFTRDANRDVFVALNKFELVQKVASLRNARMVADAESRGIDIEKSMYHCLVRTSQGLIVHEEPYQLIKLDGIKRADIKDKNGILKFTDGLSSYSFSKAKNTLSKTFELQSRGVNSTPIVVEAIADVFSLLDDRGFLNLLLERSTIPDYIWIEPGEDFVILPLYKTAKGYGDVGKASGLNAMFASEAKRKRGKLQMYIPVPGDVRKLAKLGKIHEDFFLGRGTTFEIELGNGERGVAKFTQSDGKALTSTPNTFLGDWLGSVIDGSLQTAKDRLETKRGYTRVDLERIGKDSVKLTKVATDSGHRFVLELMPVGSYEDFLSGFDDDLDA